MEINEALNEVIKGVAGPSAYLIDKVLSTNILDFDKTDDTKNMQELRESAYREEIKSKVMQSYAKTQQELAIAKRIESATEVEIEEYYDTSGKGGLNVEMTDSTVSGGLGGEGRKITKRIIRFKGIAPIEQTLDIEGTEELFERIEAMSNS